LPRARCRALLPNLEGVDLTEPTPRPRPFSGRTPWSRSLPAPLRSFLRTESGSAGVLLLATVAALVWANLAPEAYDSAWETTLTIRLGDVGLALTLREWVNSGLMTFFFFVVGLEARREFDLGELRHRRRVALPVLAGLGGMIMPVGIFLTLNTGRDSAADWGVTMSSDTAFALGLLALVARGLPDRVQIFLLTVVVVDDLVALLVIATVYSGPVAFRPLLLALGFFGGMLLLRLVRIRFGLLYFLLGAAAWVALQSSGIEPVVLGLAIGLLTSAYVPARGDLERATDLFRLFRSSPPPS
jgi:Na+/H+ antiporter NhaA